MLAHARTWFQQVPRAVYLQRLAICKGTGLGTAVNGVWTAQPCPHYWERPKESPLELVVAKPYPVPQPARYPWHVRLWRRVLMLVLKEEDVDRGCSACGCCGYKLKVGASACPIGKWPAHAVKREGWRAFLRRLLRG